MRKNQEATIALRILVTSLVVATAGLLACGSPAPETPGAGESAAQATPSVRLSYTGCGISKVAFMAELAAAYEAKTGVHIDVSGGGATKGISNANDGTADLGGGCRHKLPGPEEANAQQVHVAWDALVAIVHPDNPVESLTAAQLRAILTGEIDTWSKVGGDAATRITVAARSGKISGVGRMVRELIFGDPTVDYTSTAVIYPSSGPLEEAVEASRTMIGVTGVSSAKKRALKVLSIDGVEPTYENIASGRYPYIRPLFIYVGAQPSPEAQAFVDFAVGSEGQAVIRRQGTVNLEDGARLAPRYEASMRALNLAPELWELGSP